MKLGCYLSPHIEINSKWIRDLNIRPETIKYTEVNIDTELMNLTSKRNKSKNN